MESAIKVASFNLKHDFVFSRANSWRYRRDAVSRIIRESGAAIVGVQEMMPDMKADIVSRLEEYSVFGLGRTKRLQNEQSAILLRNEGTDLTFSSTFWLSKHPDKSGSRAYFALFPRICTVCEVYVEALGQKIRVFNTHFDHICAPARTLSVRTILEYIHQLNEVERLPVILMGDLNAGPNSKAIRILSENLHDYGDIHLTNLYTLPCAKAITSTFHGFRGRGRRRPIDYIFISDEFQVRDAYVDTTRTDGRFPSDHYPLVAVLSLKETPPEHKATPCPF
ncbi:MAG: endonuclease/exonuclease/phosphatase family protein [Clostridiales bacterium]|jgi:endonuclease/exonuclease/phosphatase family metal-dependent hydrolase|nr:endonuclease/exonuclease/phosphatase family protein [Clostridiales bacterium]